MPYNLSIPGWMTEQELQVIERWAQFIPENGKMAELGSFWGRSTWCWAKSVHPSVQVFAIDPWDPLKMITGPEDLNRLEPQPASEFQSIKNHFNVFKSNTSDCPNIHPIQIDLMMPFYWKHGYVDLVFWDDGHDQFQMLESFSFWRHRLKSKFFLCGHDHNEYFPGVQMATKKMAEILNLELKLYPGTSLWSLDCLN